MARTGTWRPVEGTVDAILAQIPPAVRCDEGERNSRRDCAPRISRGSLRGTRRAVLHPAVSSTTRAKRAVSSALTSARAWAISGAIQTPSTHMRGRPMTSLRPCLTGMAIPYRRLCGALAKMLPHKRVMTAREPDGRLYGPAIFRTYYEGLGHYPHYDSVSKRSKRYDFSVSRFDHQFAGVLCFQNSEGPRRQRRRRLVQSPHVARVSMPSRREAVSGIRGSAGHCARADPPRPGGSLLFFIPRRFHEVPFVIGSTPRVVLASFIGMSEDDPEVYVWS